MNIPIIKSEPMRIVFLKGATGVGKKTAAKLLHEHSPYSAIVDAFCFELRERCHAAFKLFQADRLPAAPMYFDGKLNEPLEEFGGISAAKAYTEFQSFVNKTLGQGAMGRWVVDRIGYYIAMKQRENKNAVPEMTIMIDDAPYDSYREVVNTFGAENCTQLLISRQGTSCAPIPIDGMRECRVNNRGDTEAAYLEAIKQAAPHLFVKIARV